METPFSIDVHLKRTHIMKGQRGECKECPHALALARACIREKIRAAMVSVGTRVAVITVDGNSYEAALPLDVQAWIRNFDVSGVPKSECWPMTYRLHFE